MGFAYHLYGLALCSNAPLNGLDSLTSAPASKIDQIDIHLGSEDAVQMSAQFRGQWRPYQTKYEHTHIPSLWYVEKEDGVYLRFQYHAWLKTHWVPSGEFIISPKGSHVWASWEPPLQFQDIQAILTGTILGCVLRLRGVLCLHASSVAINGAAVVIVGPKGSGKSTTAASLTHAGCYSIADDIVALTKKQNQYFVEWGTPQLRLTPKSADILVQGANTLSPIWSGAPFAPNDKRLFDGRLSPDSTSPLPLAAIYILDQRESSTISITPVSASFAIQSLATRMSSILLDKKQRQTEFIELGQIISNVPVRYVWRPDDMTAVLKIRDAILDNVQAILNTTNHISHHDPN